MQKIDENQNKRYSYLAKFFHWGFVFLFGYGIIKQVDNIEQLEDISLLKFEILFKITKVCCETSALLHVFVSSFYMYFRINDRAFLLVRV